jgi:flagellin-like hook-associated protein FlgL
MSKKSQVIRTDTIQQASTEYSALRARMDGAFSMFTTAINSLESIQTEMGEKKAVVRGQIDELNKTISGYEAEQTRIATAIGKFKDLIGE